MRRAAGIGVAIGLAGAVAVGFGFGSGCASPPDPNARVLLVAPDLATFAPVAAFLERRCGSLDCHGQVGRNLIVYGQDGLRLDAADVAGGAPTTTSEITATYDALIALEPEVLAAVVEQGGANPQRLTLVRKARGTEHHKGGAVVTPGDVQDVCLTSWLAGAVDAAACAAAAAP